MQLIIIKLKSRSSQAVKVQEVLTKHGGDIQVRLGLHGAAADNGDEDGLIILKVKSDQSVVNSLVSDLNSAGQVEIKNVSF
jgi:hypothetical protein